ncbi:aminotransferase class I/II-fold pyridoxal phosphate-dependent enzyme, partial [Escherichia coli]|nr:aminotransferase class I/II-fold pyridoxal phosphate-dependent enzyme [Escherichia coli]
VSCEMPKGAFYAFADFTGLLGKPLGKNGTVCENTVQLAALILDEVHVAAVPGEGFSAPGYIRFSYALADDDLAEGMHRLKEWLA